MINMKAVVRKRKSWTESIKEVDVLKEQVVALTEAVENLDEDNARLIMEKAELRQKLDEATIGMNTIIKLWNEAITERNEASEEVANLNLELMERECRIHALEQRIEWLEAHSNTGADFVS